MSDFTFQPGVLVKHKDRGEMGIVLEVLPNNNIIVFMGDGLKGVYGKGDWDIVPFHDLAGIPASFSELVEAYLLRSLDLTNLGPYSGRPYTEIMQEIGEDKNA